MLRSVSFNLRSFNYVTLSQSILIIDIFRYFSNLFSLSWLIFIVITSFKIYTNLRHWNTGLVSKEASPTTREEDASLALADDPSSDAVTVLMLCWEDDLL